MLQSGWLLLAGPDTYRATARDLLECPSVETTSRQQALKRGCALAAQGVGEHIAARSKPKIFLVNGSHDRETTAVPSMLSNLPHLAAAGPEHFSSVSSHLDDSDLCPTSPHNLTHGEATSAPAADSYSTGAASHRLHRPASRAAAQNGSGQHSGLEAPKPAGTLNDSCSAPASGATGAGSHAEPISGQEQAQLAASPGAAGFTGSAPGAALADVTTGNSQTTHAQQQTAAATQAYSRTRPLHVALPDESPSAGADSAPDSTMHSDRASSQGIRQMTASDMVLAICDALNRTHATDMPPPLNHTPDAYVTTLIAPRGGAVALDRPQLERLGIRCAPRLSACQSFQSHKGCSRTAQMLQPPSYGCFV